MIEKRTVSQCISSDYCRGWNDAVDAVVRCKDCRYFREKNDFGFCATVGIAAKISDYDYCSFAERKGKVSE